MHAKKKRRTLTELHKKRIGEAVSKAKLGVPFSEEHKAAMSIAAKNKARVECEHCGKVVTKAMYKRWHGDACKWAPAEKSNDENNS